jgi:hypothetical protein
LAFGFWLLAVGYWLLALVLAPDCETAFRLAIKDDDSKLTKRVVWVRRELIVPVANRFGKI